MITSPQNDHIRHVRSLISDRKSRKKKGMFVIEGIRLSEEAIHNGWIPEMVFISENLNERGLTLVNKLKIPDKDILSISSGLMAELSDTETPQGILCIMKEKPCELPERIDFLLILDEIRDPGNLGTLLRAGCAAGVQTIILTPGTTDLYSPKVLRAGMGAHFHLPVLNLDWPGIQSLSKLNKSGQINLVAADSKMGESLWKFNFLPPTALVVGSEAFGLSPTAQKYITHKCTIPMPGNSESLNAALAGGILLFEVVRQRSAYLTK